MGEQQGKDFTSEVAVLRTKHRSLLELQPDNKRFCWLELGISCAQCFGFDLMMQAFADRGAFYTLNASAGGRGE